MELTLARFIARVWRRYDPAGARVRAASPPYHGHGYFLPRSKIWLFPTTRPNELLCNCTRVVGPDGRELNTLNARDFTDAEFEGRLQVREYARFFREHLEAAASNSFVVDTGTQVGVRQTRQARGMATLANADILAGRKFADGIARSPWPIELHAGAKPRVEWLLEDCYEIPFRVFCSTSRGWFAYGRALSLGATRSGGIGPCDGSMFLLWPGCGARRCDVSLSSGVEPRALPGQAVREVLKPKRGPPRHRSCVA